MCAVHRALFEAVSSERLVIFCADGEADLEVLRAELDELFERCGVSGVEMKRVGGPEALTEAGWAALSLHAPDDGRTRLGQRLAEVTRGIARVLREEALGVYVDGQRATAAACFAKPRGLPRGTSGDPFHVVRQAASWIETDASQLARYFSVFDRPKNELVGPLDLTRATGSGSDAKQRELEGDPPAEMDEDDRYVEAKLKHARELMEKYRAARK